MTNAEFRSLIERAHRRSPMVHRGHVAFTVPEKDLVPEGSVVSRPLFIDDVRAFSVSYGFAATIAVNGVDGNGCTSQSENPAVLSIARCSKTV
jgi:hypothetical protein